ncbi:hypothetical protein M569_09795 [Genlisea aurea]|uniref:U3 small nucleolar RNA-associated protein 6 homolog n=1 Tax=Genlisea aurea TaxID=192259 RepID=S8CDQ4_9LAMI|nr:hypothetical protein M569_09795 [Genlisea aurea]
MADAVQFKLESMLDELDDLEKTGLFSRQEIAEIVKQRRKFEYRLKRRSPLKKDFLAYIEYEKQLDTLRGLRMKTYLKKSGYKKLASIHAGVRRIIKTYEIATNRFKGDIELWFQYLEFCKARKHGRMKKVALAQLVRFHPKVPSVWIYAAAWEFDSNLNVSAARALMQKGLRECPTSEDLWVEYLRMELTHLNKLKVLKIALDEEDKGKHSHEKIIPDKELRKDDHNESFMSLNIDSGGESDGKQDVFGEHGLVLLQTVYSSAIKALPYSFSLRKRFLEILESSSLLHSDEMRSRILDDLRKDFSEDPEYWDWMARVEIAGQGEKNSENLTRGIQVYDKALETMPSATIIELYVKFLVDITGDGLQSNDHHTMDLVSPHRMIFEKAEKLGCVTDDLAFQHVTLLLRLGNLDEAKALMEKLCTEKLPHAIKLWALRLSLEMSHLQGKTNTPSKGDLRKFFELLKTALMKFSITEAETVWLTGLKYFADHRSYFDKLVELSFLLLTRDGGCDDGFSLSSVIVNYVLERDGVESARNVYKRFLRLPHPGLVAYRNFIELELNQCSGEDASGLGNARKLFESALSTYDQDAGLWQDFYAMEIKMGTSESASAVCWRATKALQSSGVSFRPKS